MLVWFGLWSVKLDYMLVWFVECKIRLYVGLVWFGLLSGKLDYMFVWFGLVCGV